jgi:D-lactate dehydrogenase
LARLLTFPNVLVTSHQAFLTHEALDNIAETTANNIRQFLAGEQPENAVRATT